MMNTKNNQDQLKKKTKAGFFLAGRTFQDNEQSN